MKPVLILPLVGCLTAAIAPTTGAAQTRSVRDTATAYGARLTAKGTPANMNQHRINNRINSRIDNRIGLRIERYRPDSTNNPTATLRGTQDDKSRTAPVIDPMPVEDAPE